MSASVLAVDLAAKYSACVYLNSVGSAERSFSSAGRCEADFLTMLHTTFLLNFTDQLVVEDLPHGVGYRNLVKRVCQLQGRIAERMDSSQKLDHLLFVAPETWRRHYPELRKRGVPPEVMIDLAGERGFKVPDLEHLKGPRGGAAIANKVATDFAAAYLIAAWAQDIHADRQSFEGIPGTSRYGQPAITKPKPAKANLSKMLALQALAENALKEANDANV